MTFVLDGAYAVARSSQGRRAPGLFAASARESSTCREGRSWASPEARAHPSMPAGELKWTQSPRASPVRTSAPMRKTPTILALADGAACT